MTEALPVHIGDIAPGQTFNVQSSLKIEGNIGAGAKITLCNGGLVITGNVADNVQIYVEEASEDYKRKARDGSVTINSSKMIIKINGDVVSGSISNPFNEKTSLSGLTIEGSVGDHVTLISSSSIHLKSYAGNNLTAEAKSNSFTATTVGDACQIKAQNSVNIESIGDNSNIVARNSVNIASIAPECVIEAGNSVNAFSIGLESKVMAGNSIRAKFAHVSVKAKAGNKVKIEKYLNCQPTHPRSSGTDDTGPR